MYRVTRKHLKYRSASKIQGIQVSPSVKPPERQVTPPVHGVFDKWFCSHPV